MKSSLTLTLLGVLALWPLSLVNAQNSTAPTTAPVVDRSVTYEPAVPIREGAPDDRFLKAHDMFLARIKQGPIGALFVGDSITAGWTRNKELFTKSFGQYQPANFGVSGDRTQHVLWRLNNGELDIAPAPKVIVLMIGTNNVRRDQPADVARGVEAILTLIHEKRPTTKVLLLGVLPMGVDPADPKVAADREKITKINELLKAFAAEPNIVFHDMGKKFLNDDGRSSDAMRTDGVHLETRGYEIWAASIVPLLAEMTK